MHQIVLTSIGGHVPHVVLVREEQPRRNLVPPLARVLVQLTIVIPFVALAVVSSGGVGAVLRTYSRLLRALVNIRTRLTVT